MTWANVGGNETGQLATLLTDATSAAKCAALAVRHSLLHNWNMPPTRARKSIPLTAEDQAQLDRLRTPGTPEHEALSQMSATPIPDNASEAETLHALLSVGHAVILERVMLAGYAALAAAQDDEDRSARRAMRDRAARLGD